MILKRPSLSVAAGVFIALLPFLVLPVAADMPTQFDLPKLMGIFLLGNLVFAAALSRVHPVFSVIHGWISISTVITGFGPPQLYFFAYWTAGITFAAWFALQEGGAKERILRIIAGGSVLVAVHCYIQVLWRDPVLQYAPGINPHLPIAFLRQHTLLGAYLAPMCALNAALRRWKSALFLLPICLLAHSNFTLLALGGALSVVLLDFQEGKWWFARLAALAAIVLSGLYRIRPGTFFSHGRVDVWRETISWWWANARWIGRGGGSFRVLYPPRLTALGELVPHTGIQGEGLYSHGAFLQAHNDYVQALFEFGLVGGVVLLLLLATIAFYYSRDGALVGRHRWLLGCQAMLVGFALNAVGNFPWQLAPHFLLGLMSLAVVLHYGWKGETIP